MPRHVSLRLTAPCLRVPSPRCITIWTHMLLVPAMHVPQWLLLSSLWCPESVCAHTGATLALSTSHGSRDAAHPSPVAMLMAVGLAMGLYLSTCVQHGCLSSSPVLPCSRLTWSAVPDRLRWKPGRDHSSKVVEELDACWTMADSRSIWFKKPQKG